MNGGRSPRGLLALDVVPTSGDLDLFDGVVPCHATAGVVGKVVLVVEGHDDAVAITTLVVDVTALIEDTWFDRAGNFHSDTMHVVERYTPRGPNLIQYEATIDDPAVFTRPWTIRMPLYRRLEPNAQLLEFKCVPFAESLLYGHLKKPER